jgi:hypothetical protein
MSVFNCLLVSYGLKEIALILKIFNNKMYFCFKSFSYEKHSTYTTNTLALGAKMVPFAGYNMPVSYSGLNDEHLTVRNALVFLMLATWVNLF